MPEIGQALNSASLFAGVLGLLFASWIEGIKAATEQSLPPHYLDRKAHFSTISAALWGKAVPLVLILIAFTISYLPVAVRIATTGQLIDFEDISEGTVQIE